MSTEKSRLNLQTLAKGSKARLTLLKDTPVKWAEGPRILVLDQHAGDCRVTRMPEKVPVKILSIDSVSTPSSYILL